MKSELQASELVLAPNGSVYHLHVTGEDIADDIFLVGDPDRVNMFKELFDTVEFETQNRELHIVTGFYRGHRFSALSTGMGTDNIDIVINELDAAANIDLRTRSIKQTHRSLNLIRIGTSGSLHSGIKTGDLVASQYAIGMDGLLNFYTHETSLFEEDLLCSFLKHMQFDSSYARPYACRCSQDLFRRVAFDMHQGITVTAPGFYAPQGRKLRISPAIDNLNERLAAFRFNNIPITNLEMEASAIYGLGKLLGHNALTVCLIIANRADGTFLNDYHHQMRETIQLIMNRMSQQ